MRGWWVGMVAVALIGGCSVDSGGACDEGSEACACRDDDTCDDGLTCASDRCVNLNPTAGSGGGAGNGGSSGSGGGAGSAGQGGSAGSAGGGGSAGTGGTVPPGGTCAGTPECAAPTDPCRVAVCIAQRCSTAAQPNGHRLPDDTAGDCRVHVCEGGDIQTIADASDIPAEDDDPCTRSACDGLNPVQEPVTTGTPLPPESQVAGDCKRFVCSDSGIGVETDASDLPASPSNPCLTSVCNGSNPGTAFAPVGRGCGTNQVCDDSGDCVACKQDGVTCGAGPECCGGACTGDQCAACPSGQGDCDGVSANGCETALNTAANCGACGNNCSELPHVAVGACTTGSCSITRCEAHRANADGNVANGCEAMASVGPGGPYAHCTRATATADCGIGERCVVATGGITTPMISACPDGNLSTCFCGYPCGVHSDCPTPTGGSAMPRCASGACYLDCVSSATCQSGMSCMTYTFISLYSSYVCVPQ